MEREKLNQGRSRVWFPASSISFTWMLVRNTKSKALTPTSDLLNQKLWGWVQQSVLISPVGDSDVS